MDAIVIQTPYDPAIEDIQKKFDKLRGILNEREASLLTRIRSLKEEYLKTSHTKITTIKALLRHRGYIEENTRDNEEMLKEVAEIDDEVSALQSELGKRAEPVSVSWGSEGLDKLCELVKKIGFEDPTATASQEGDRYKRMVNPVFQGGRLGEGSASDVISYPNHLCIDESSQNIYVSDFRQNCVVVFDSQAHLINKFSTGIRFPRAIACKDSKLYLVENSHSMQHLVLKKFSLQSGIAPVPCKYVKPPRDLLNVSALDVSSTGDWYICNRQAHKVHCFSQNAYSTFLTSAPVHHPTAIRVRDRVYILESYSDQPASIKMFSFHGVIISSIPLYSVLEPLYFDIDREGSFIVCESAQDSIVIFEKTGSLHHRITSSKKQPLTRPKGVAVSGTGNLVVVTNNLEGTLLIF